MGACCTTQKVNKKQDIINYRNEENQAENQDDEVKFEKEFKSNEKNNIDKNLKEDVRVKANPFNQHILASKAYKDTILTNNDVVKDRSVFLEDKPYITQNTPIVNLFANEKEKELLEVQDPFQIPSQVNKHEHIDQSILNEVNKLSKVKEGSNFRLAQKFNRMKSMLKSSKEDSEKNLTSVFSESEQEQKDYTFLLNSFDDCILTKNLHPKFKEKLLKKMKQVNLFHNNVVFIESILGHYIFTIFEGCVSFYKNNMLSHELNTGRAFGREILYHNVAREYTAITKEKSKLLVLTKEAFYFDIWEFSKKNYKFIRTILANSGLFNCLDESIQVKIASFIGSNNYYPEFKREEDHDCRNGYFEYLLYEKDEYIIDPTINKNIEPAIYLINDGKVKFEPLDGKQPNFNKSNMNDESFNNTTINNLDISLLSFGESSILLKQNFNYKVKCVESDIEVLKIYPSTFISLFGDKYLPLLFYNVVKSLVGKDSELSCIPEEVIYKLYFTHKVFKISRYNNNKVVLRPESIADRIYICLSGFLYSSNSFTIILKQFNLLYTSEIIKNFYIHPNELINASEDCLLVECKYSEMEKYLEKKIISYKRQGVLTSFLSTCNVFNLLTYDKLKILSEKITKQLYIPDSVIITENQVIDKFYMVKKGRLIITKQNQRLNTEDEYEEQIIGEKECFGYKNLVVRERSTFKMKCLETTEVYELKSDDFHKVCDSSFCQYLTNYYYLVESNVNLHDLYYLETLRKTEYGDVFVVKNIRLGILYAVRQYKKEKINTIPIMKSIDQEKRISSDLIHPFCSSFITYFKDESNILFVFELINGISLKQLLEEKCRLEINDTQFYIACIIELCDYLHKKKISCRNFDTENILIDSKVRINKFNKFLFLYI